MNMPLDNYWYTNRLYVQLMNFRGNEIKVAKNIKQNFVNPACTGLEICKIIKRSGLSDSTFTDLSSYR